MGKALAHLDWDEGCLCGSVSRRKEERMIMEKQDRGLRDRGGRPYICDAVVDASEDGGGGGTVDHILSIIGLQTTRQAAMGLVR